MFQNPGMIDDALAASGSEYRLPQSFSTSGGDTPPAAAFTPSTEPPSASGGAAAPAAAPTSAAPAPAPSSPSTSAPPPEESNMAEKMQSIEDSAAVARQAKDNGAMQKVGALISTVLSAYTGNYAGVAGGVASMQNAGK